MASDARLTAQDASPDAADAGVPSCSLPVAGTLNLPTSTVMGTLRGPSMNMTTSCTTDLGTQGPEALYRLNVTERTGVILRTTAATNTVLAIRRLCDDPVTEVACNNDGPMPPNATLRAILDPGSYYVLVDVYAFGIGGDYTLSLETFTAPPNGTCASATPVSDGAKVQGDLTNAAVPPRSISCPSVPTVPAGVLYYKATIPAGNKLVAKAQGSMSQPFMVEVLDSCTSSTCRSGGLGQATDTNDGATSRDVIITVGSAMPPPPPGPPLPPGAPGASVTFELDVSIQPLASNATCAAATAVSPGMMVTGDNSYGGADLMSPCMGGPFPPGVSVSGPLWYSVAVPAGQMLRVNLTTIDPFPPVVGALDTCGSGAMCLTPSGRPPPGPGSVLLYTNGGASTKNVLFYVGHAPFGGGGRFSFTVSIDPLASNASCSMPTALTDGVAVQGDTTIGSTGTLPCYGPAIGMLYYSMTVPAGKTLGVELKPSTPWDAHVAILDSCSLTPACLGTSFSGPVSTTTFTNASGSPRSVIIAVAAGFTGGSFSVTGVLRDPPTNITCGAATPVTNGTSLTFQDATAATDNLASRCLPTDTGGVLYYSATIGAGQSLKATATSTAKWLPSLRLLASCDASTCLASSSLMPMPFPQNTVSYLNAGGSPMNVILAVGPAAMFGPAGYFDLNISITP
jgi:hypothetical protein